MLKRNISPKSPRIKLFNDTFAERKCSEVFAFETETFHRRRSNGISHCKNGAPRNLPFPLHEVDPHVIQQCLGPSHAPPQTAAPTVEAMVEALSHNAHVRRKVPIGYNGEPEMCPQKYPFPWTDLQTPLPASSHEPVRPMMPNGIQIRSTVCLQYTGQTDRPTDRPTNRQIVHGKV